MDSGAREHVNHLRCVGLINFLYEKKMYMCVRHITSRTDMRVTTLLLCILGASALQCKLASTTTTVDGAAWFNAVRRSHRHPQVRLTSAQATWTDCGNSFPGAADDVILQGVAANETKMVLSNIGQAIKVSSISVAK